MELLQINADRIIALPDRKLTEETCRKFDVWVNDRGEHVYPYFDAKGKHVANKFRMPNKGFMVQGEIQKTGLFGQQCFPAGGFKQITIVEGELDALSAYQMMGSKYPVVSVRGASSAEHDCAHNYEYLNAFEQIVICFDKDKPHVSPDGSSHCPGQEAAQKVAALFELGKVRVLTLAEAKDASDYLVGGLGDKFNSEWWKAPTWTPAGLKFAKDLWEEVSSKRNYETIFYPWDGLNYMTYGLRLGEMVTITADTGVGKTQVLREIVFSALTNSDKRLGLIFLEESNRDTILGQMSILANKPLHLPDVLEKVDNDELGKYFHGVVDTDRLVLWDHFGSNEIDQVLATVRHLSALGCKYIFLDHLSIVVSDQNGDERKQLDEISTKLKQLCMELNICLISVIHQNRKGEIRGTAGVEQLSNMVIKLFREKEDDDPWRRNVTKVVIQKNRFCGRTGPACYLYYNSEDGRMSELTPDEAKRYEAGAAAGDPAEQW